MDIIKTIFRLSFFLLGCIMLVFTLLVLSVDSKSILFFSLFSLGFFLLGYKYTFAVIKGFFKKLFKLLHIPIYKKSNDRWINMCHENLSYNLKLKQIKLNSKIYSFEQIESIDIIANSKRISEKELLKLDKIKNLEIKIGTKIKKITYRHFKYITSVRITDKVKRKQIKNSIDDYKQLNKILKKNCK